MDLHIIRDGVQVQRIILGIFLISLSLSASAKIYTREQLYELVNSGNYPEENDAQTSSDDNSEFKDCKNKAKRAMDKYSKALPVNVLSDNSNSYSVKLWAKDGTISIICSGSDNRMKIKNSTYK